MNKLSMVREFMQAAQQETPLSFIVPPVQNIRKLRAELIFEELKEFCKASGLYCEGGIIGRSWEAPADIVGVADAIADLLYVVYGAAVAYGINIDPVFGEVHRSNMTKFIDGHRRDDGKWVKGPSYEPARIKEVLDAQSNT